MNKYSLISEKIIKDYFTPDSEKLERIVERDIVKGLGSIFPIVGDRGSGKTVLMYLLAERAWNKGRDVYIVGPPQKHPSFMERVPHLLDVPQGGLALVDEAAIKYFCREAMFGDQRESMKLLNTARHRDTTILLATQALAASDKMISVVASGVFIKYQGIFTEAHERAEVRDILAITKPRTVFGTLFWRDSGNFYFIKRTPLGELWKEGYSKPYTSLAGRHAEAWKMARELKEVGYTPNEIYRELKARSFRVTREEVEWKLYGEAQVVPDEKAMEVEPIVVPE